MERQKGIVRMFARNNAAAHLYLLRNIFLFTALILLSPGSVSFIYKIFLNGESAMNLWESSHVFF